MRAGAPRSYESSLFPWPRPEDIATLIPFLLPEGSSYMAGSVYQVQAARFVGRGEWSAELDNASVFHVCMATRRDVMLKH